MQARLWLCLLTSPLALGCTAHASIAAHPITNEIAYSHGEELRQCDTSGTECGNPVPLGFKPIDAVIVASGDLWFLSESAVHPCTGTGTPCGAVQLGKARKGVSITSGSNNVVFVVTSKGEVLRCDRNQCEVAKADAGGGEENGGGVEEPVVDDPGGEEDEEDGLGE